MNDQIEPLFLIDTNILVYAYDNTDPRKHEIAKKLLEPCWKKQKTYAISSQNLAEFFIVITKKVPHPLSIDEAEKIILDITTFTHWKVLHYTKDTLLKAISLYKKPQKQFWDALIAATMIEGGIFHLYTENTADFMNFEKIKVRNPLAEKK